MKRLLMMASVVVLLAAAAMADEGVPGFLTDYQQARTKARKLNKPMYLHFTTTWCGWCRKIEDEIYKSAEGKKILEPFVTVSLDCTDPENNPQHQANQKLLQKYGGSGYPYLVVTAPDGTRLSSWSGYLPMQPFRQQISLAVQNFRAYEEFKTYARKADKSSLEFNKKALAFYSQIEQWDHAATAAENLLKLDPQHRQTNPAKIAFARFRGAVENQQIETAKTLEKKVIDADPKNKHGYLEKVYWARAMSYLNQARTQDKMVQQKNLAKLAETLEALVVQADQLYEPQDVYSLLGFAQANLGRYEKAIRTHEKLLEIAPEAQKPDIQKMIRQLEEAQSARKP